jgi:hypothetical protein
MARFGLRVRLTTDAAAGRGAFCDDTAGGAEGKIVWSLTTAADSKV